MVDLIAGPVPRRDDYFGREKLIEHIWTQLKNNNILLVAPRRYGKTGAMFNLLDEQREPYKPIYIDVESIMSPGSFMVELYAALIQDDQLRKSLNTLLEGAKSFGSFLRGLADSISIHELKIEIRENTDIVRNWPSYGERIQSLFESSPPLLLMIDEFAYMINHIIKKHGVDEASQLLSWFRSARQAPQTTTRFLIGSSINLEDSLNSHGLVDTINDLYQIKVEPFEKETAEQFIETVFESQEINIEPNVADKIVELIGASIPYVLVLFLNAIISRFKLRGEEITEEMVVNVFENDLIAGSASSVFKHYRSRISEYYEDDEIEPAKAILCALSRTDSPLSQERSYTLYLREIGLPSSSRAQEKFQELMSKLNNDFYVVDTDGGYDFLSRALKLWWKNHYGFQGE